MAAACEGKSCTSKPHASESAASNLRNRVVIHMELKSSDIIPFVLSTKMVLRLKNRNKVSKRVLEIVIFAGACVKATDTKRKGY